MITLSLISAAEQVQKWDNSRLEQLISSLADGDHEALAELYSLTDTAVYGFALSILKNRHDAEDVMQSTYVSLYSSAAAYTPQGKPMAWVLTIVRNLCLMRIRDSKKTSELPQDDYSHLVSDQLELPLEERIVLRACLDILSEEERQIVILHSVGGFKHREISGILDLALPTVLSKYNRALKKLRAFLTKEAQQ